MSDPQTVTFGFSNDLLMFTCDHYMPNQKGFIMSQAHEYSSRFEALLARDVFGVPLVVIILGFAALGVATLVALTATN